LDPAGEAGEALRSAVQDFGSPVLSNPRMLENLLEDLMPSNKAAAKLLVRAAEFDVAGVLQRHMAEGVGVDAAVRLTADAFAADSSIAPDNCLWVAIQFARAMGQQPNVDAIPSPPPASGTAGAGPAMTDLAWGGPSVAAAGFAPPGSGTGTPGAEEVTQGPQWAPASAGLSGTAPAQTPPSTPGWQPPSAGGGPPVQPAGWTPGGTGGTPPTSSSGKGKLWAAIGAGVAVIVIIVVVVVVVAGKSPKKNAGSNTSSTTTTATTSATTAPTTTPTTAPATTATTAPAAAADLPLSELIPDQNAPSGFLPIVESTDCKTESPYDGFVGVQTGLTCDIPGEADWLLNAFKFDTFADYSTSLSQLLLHRSIDLSTAENHCPPPNIATNAAAQGADSWFSKQWKATSGQDLFCEYFVPAGTTTKYPDYIWTNAAQDAIFELAGSPTTPFSDIENWWSAAIFLPFPSGSS
jgi:hypothetical protein